MNYWHYTGDDSYNDVTYNALVSQLGPAGDFVMPTEAFDEVSLSTVSRFTPAEPDLPCRAMTTKLSGCSPPCQQQSMNFAGRQYHTNAGRRSASTPSTTMSNAGTYQVVVAA